jgi:hypothetical protein
VKSSCLGITRGELVCEFPGAAQSGGKSISCLWVTKEKEEYGCQEVKSSCELITDGPEVCEFEGVAKSGENALVCTWLVDEQKCKSNVC